MRPLPPLLSALVAASVAFSCFPAGARGEDEAREDLPPTARAVIESAVVPAMEQIPGELLDLEGALAAAMAQAPSLKVAQATLAVARGELRRAQGTFDPELFGHAERRSDEQPSATFFAGADVVETETARAEAGARMTLPLGTELEASVGATRTETNSSFASLNPQYDTLGEFTVRQPLLDGFGAGTRGALSAAERNMEAAQARFENTRLSVQALVESTYWELFAAGRDYAVQLAIIAQAEALLDQAQLRREAGLVGPEAVASADVFLAEQEQVRFDRLESMGVLSDRLASLIGRRPADASGLFRPGDSPPDEFTVVEPELLVERAVAENRELRGLERDLARVRELHRAARRNALPSLDLIGGVGGRGLGGDPQEVNFGGDTFTSSIDAGAGDALSQALGGDFPNWSIGLDFSIPLGNRGDGGEKDRLAAEVARAEQNLEAARRDLEERVRAQQRVLAHGAERLAAARRGVEAADEQVRIGVLEFQNGRTTAFELVRLGTDLTQAQQRYSDALVRTARATAVLRQLLGGESPIHEGQR